MLRREIEHLVQLFLNCRIFHLSGLALETLLHFGKNCDRLTEFVIAIGANGGYGIVEIADAIT